MPAYEYICKDCSKEFSIFLSIKEFEAKPKIQISLQNRARNRKSLMKVLTLK